MSERTPLLVLGLGNVLLEDDGIGVAAVAILRDRYEPPAGVRVHDGGTLGLALLPYLEAADAVILVDAIRADGPPGSFVRLDGDDVESLIGLRPLDGARWLGRFPDRIVLLGLIPESMELAVGLSPRVRAALPGLVDRIVAETRAMGFVFDCKSSHEPSVARSGIDVARLAGLQ